MYELYSLFGVPRTSTDDEIKQAFRSLAKRYHPDTLEGASDKGRRFKDLSSAYEILGDPIKRRAYDRGEIDGYGNPRAGYNPRQAAEREAERERERAREARAEEKETASTTQTQRESARSANGSGGASAAFRSAFEKAFGSGANGHAANGSGNGAANGSAANGSGAASGGGAANGSGAPGGKQSRVEDLFSEFFGDRSSGKKRPAHGKGIDTSYDLSVTFEEAVLGGTRRVKMPNGKRFDVRLPVGTREGQAIRLKGLGESDAAGGQEGDAIITVNIEPHPFFRRDGRDIHLDLPITLNEALHGAKIKVPTLHGPVTMVIPPGANAGQVFRLKGKGIPSHAIHPAGDQFVTLQIALPDKADPNLVDVVKRWEAANPYNPRRKFGEQT